MTSNKQLIENDYQKGLKSEIKFNEILNTFFNNKFKMTSRYNIFDYITYDGNIYVEFKERFVYSNTYKSTMVGINKVNVACTIILNGLKVYFFFKFIDCIKYYEFIEYDKSYIGNGGRVDRNKNEMKENGYYYIPNEKLKLL